MKKTVQSEERCKARVFRAGAFSGSSCARSATKDGYCTQHHPEAEKARSDARKAEWDRQAKEKLARWKADRQDKEKLARWKAEEKKAKDDAA